MKHKETYVMVYLLMLLMPAVNAAGAAWHPAGWDMLLPAGVTAIRADGYRIVPDLALTPGVMDPNVTLAQLASPAYIKAARNVPANVKRHVYTEYAIPADKVAGLRVKMGTAPFEVDHDISLENGGKNDVGNLWPEPYWGPWNAHDKDRLENYLHRLCKAGTINLAEDQDEIRGYHWVWSYVHYFGTPESAK